MRILVVEDERKVANALREGLEAEQYQVTLAHTGEEGFFLFNAQIFDLVILDVMLPGRDGFEILGAIRKANSQLPVLLLTARDSVNDRVLGLDTGADDYLVKPFEFPELLARVRALLRRGRLDAPVRMKIADLEMDVTTRTATRIQQTLDLTAREFDLLAYLVRNQGRVISREMIAHDVWKEGPRHTPLDNVIDVNIARLRRKLDDPFQTKLLHTVRGVGFVLKDGAE
ncbi:MAG TPA: response regulator transcription factor [Terriglobales bacterium]|nr:response regulator transcription factor [Terriglobales bacterium]